jgi:hypothetical protein
MATVSFMELMHAGLVVPVKLLALRIVQLRWRFPGMKDRAYNAAHKAGCHPESAPCFVSSAAALLRLRGKGLACYGLLHFPE